MAYIITFIASVLLLISFMLLIFTSTMKKLLFFFFDARWINTVIVIRMLMGFVIIAAAPFTGFPNLMLFLGIAIIFLAITMPFFSEEQLELMAEWWLLQSNWMLRLYALVFIPVWLFFVIASLPDPTIVKEYILPLLPHTH